ncbi:hypothetical protein [Chryseosolibacter indicus]|uniref:LPP20 lipoprotein n=1 Tax=Chryseosolibacter indicus TaxID=2782351 RepID=A0ABS5VQ56_9BACT|nr:hypothetical protein [Chryseosolibacter indicus]MBT1703476.1 hypothetical protein [Chryseosolibacter indicus]
MKFRPLLFAVFIVVLSSCSSGKKAYEKGDYYGAVVKSVNRLKQKPDHSKSKETLKGAYPLALQSLEQEAQNMLASNEMFKSRNTINIYNRVNELYEVVKSSPAALTVIKSPKNYYSEIGPLKEKASEELYGAGITAMMKATRRDSREAYFYFKECEGYTPRYKEALEMMTQSERDGTLTVMYEESAYNNWTSSGNFIRQLDEIQFIELVNKNIAVTQMGRKFDLNMLVSIQNYSEKKPVITKKEYELIDSVKVGEKVVNKVKVPTYQTIRGKYIENKITVESEGTISIVIVDPKTGNKVFSDDFRGTGIWKDTWGTCSGDQRVFSKSQKDACATSTPRPDSQALRKQAMEDLDKQVYSRLSGFLKNY